MKFENSTLHVLASVCLLGNWAALCGEIGAATQFLVDGNVDDWQSVPLLIEDARSPAMEKDKAVDVYQVKAGNDLQNLYFYVSTTKAPMTVMGGQSGGGSSGLFVIYIDTDGDATTGCRDVKLMGANGKTIAGFELQLVASAGRNAGSLGVLGGKDGPFAKYNLYAPGPKKSFSFRDRKRLAEKYSIYRKRLVALCPMGIEMALPLAEYGIKSKSKIRLLVHKLGNMGQAKYPTAVYPISAPPDAAKAEK